MSSHLVALTAVTSSLTDAGQSGLRALAIGLGAVGAGTGIGLIFEGVIESVTPGHDRRHPHPRYWRHRLYRRAPGEPPGKRGPPSALPHPPGRAASGTSLPHHRDRRRRSPGAGVAPPGDAGRARRLLPRAFHGFRRRLRRARSAGGDQLRQIGAGGWDCATSSTSAVSDRAAACPRTSPAATRLATSCAAPGS
jgi:hypothetical protein